MATPISTTSEVIASLCRKKRRCPCWGITSGYRGINISKIR